MADRAEFLESIRHRTRTGKYKPTHAPDVAWTSKEGRPRESPPIEDPPARFLEELEALGGHGKRAANLDEARGYILSLARERGARLVLISKNNTAPLAREADAVLQIPTQLCTQKLQTKGSEFEQSLFILCDNIGVELMLRLGCIRQIRDIDPFIRVLHANLQ